MATQEVEPVGGTEKEPFIPYAKVEDQPESLKAVLAPYVERMGFLPNALRLHMHRPEIAETLWTLNSKIMRDPSSTLDQGLKRRLSAIASNMNGCTYCTAHCCSMLHRQDGPTGEGWGMDPADLTRMLQGDLQPANEMERACWDFVRAASEDPGSVPHELLGRLKTYLTPPQIIELASVVGFWKMYNTIHDALKIPVEAHLENDVKYVEI
jgi:uncharacterized peroxidase-related enzyme